MMTWTAPLLPLLAGLLLWGSHLVVPAWRSEGAPRRVLGLVAVVVALATATVAGLAAATGASATYVAGPGLELVAELGALAATVAVLVPLIAAPVLAYATVHEERLGLHRLVSLLLVFVGAMELIVVAGDVLTMLIGWELVGALSWALIGHEWRDAERPKAAAHAFNATRFGGLGLFVAAGAGFAQTGSFAFADWTSLEGSALHWVAGGVVLAAVSKSGQVPFAPWLFSAMAGPTPVSALLHSSTMVAAGAFALARLHPILDPAPWFGETLIVVGLVTALAAGVVGLLQQHAKKLLAASTSAQYGLMIVAVGAGYPAVAIAHLVVHAFFKAQLFLSAGIASSATGSLSLPDMRLGRHRRTTAIVTLVGSLSLAAVPPLAGSWSKEEIVTAATHQAVWVGLLVILAGGLTAVYATRFQVLAYGRRLHDDAGPRDLGHPPGVVETGALVYLAVPLVLLSAAWLPGVKERLAGWFGSELPTGEPWELALSFAILLGAAYATVLADRDGRLGSIGATGAAASAADWLGLPTVIERVVVRPALAFSHATARFDDHVLDRIVELAGAAGNAVSSRLAPFDRRVVDAGVRGAAHLAQAISRLGSRFGERGMDGAVELVAATVDRASSDVRRMQTGLVHHQYVVIVSGIAIAIAAAVVGR